MLSVLANHMNAKVVAGTVQSSRQDTLDFLDYGMEDTVEEGLNSNLSGLVGKALDELEDSYCVETETDGRSLYTTVLGRIVGYYYLTHTVVSNISKTLKASESVEEVLQVLEDATEFESGITRITPIWPR